MTADPAPVGDLVVDLVAALVALERANQPQISVATEAHHQAVTAARWALSDALHDPELALRLGGVIYPARGGQNTSTTTPAGRQSTVVPEAPVGDQSKAAEVTP